MSAPRRPEVLLVRSSAPALDAPARSVRPPRRWALLSLTAFVLLLAGTTQQPVAAPAPEELAVQLVAQPQELTVSQGGVLVLPLELRNDGAADLSVTLARAYAEPVVQDAVAQAPQDVAARDSRRFVVLIAPDCRLLRTDSPIDFRATVLLRVAGERESRDLVVDAASAPAVRRVVRGLCG